MTGDRKHSKKDLQALLIGTHSALDAQTVCFPGTDVSEVAIPLQATNIKVLSVRRKSIV